MDAAANKALVRDYLALLCSDDWSAWDDYFAPDVAFNGAAGLREWATRAWQPFRAALADLRIVVEDQIAEGDRVATRVTFQARGHDDSEVRYLGIAVDRIAEGRVVEMWHIADHRGELAKLRRHPPV